MNFKIILEPRTKLDLQQAVDYYDSKQIGLGYKFIEAFEINLKIIASNPFFAIIYKDYRALIIKEFPLYQIIFFINEQKKTIYIDAVFHTSQNPTKKP